MGTALTAASRRRERPKRPETPRGPGSGPGPRIRGPGQFGAGVPGSGPFWRRCPEVRVPLGGAINSTLSYTSDVMCTTVEYSSGTAVVRFGRDIILNVQKYFITRGARGPPRRKSTADIRI